MYILIKQYLNFIEVDSDKKEVDKINEEFKNNLDIRSSLSNSSDHQKEETKHYDNNTNVNLFYFKFAKFVGSILRI